MLNQKKVEIFLVKIRKSLAKQFLEIALMYYLNIQTFFNKPEKTLDWYLWRPLNHLLMRYKFIKGGLSKKKQLPISVIQ